MTWAGGGLLVVAALGCAKPCDPIPMSATIKSLGFVLPGGRVCKDDKGVATVDYPDADAGELTNQHKTVLGKAGWKMDSPSEGVLLATKDKNTLFIVTGKKSADRRVPFAVVSYCQEESCKKRLTDIANAMKKL
jgi:hypothetical protein